MRIFDQARVPDWGSARLVTELRKKVYSTPGPMGGPRSGSWRLGSPQDARSRCFGTFAMTLDCFPSVLPRITSFIIASHIGSAQDVPTQSCSRSQIRRILTQRRVSSFKEILGFGSKFWKSQIRPPAFLDRLRVLSGLGAWFSGCLECWARFSRKIKTFYARHVFIFIFRNAPSVVSHKWLKFIDFGDFGEKSENFPKILIFGHF